MKTYKVTGGAPVFDTEPGQTFQADLSPEQEKRMTERGSIEVVGSTPQVPATPPPSGEGDKSGGGKSPGKE